MAISTLAHVNAVIYADLIGERKSSAQKQLLFPIGTATLNIHHRRDKQD
jgi:hypothetical protein